MKTKQFAEILGISEKDSQFILNTLATDQKCKKVVYAGERYRYCTMGEDKHSIWNNL